MLQRLMFAFSGKIGEVELVRVIQHFLPHLRIRHLDYLVDKAGGGVKLKLRDGAQIMHIFKCGPLFVI